MKENTEFPFAHARRISPSEVIAAEQAIEEQFGINYTRRGRPAKSEAEKYQSVSIRWEHLTCAMSINTYGDTRKQKNRNDLCKRVMKI
jgi:hypothetical protein